MIPYTFDPSIMSNKKKIKAAMKATDENHCPLNTFSLYNFLSEAQFWRFFLWDWVYVSAKPSQTHEQYDFSHIIIQDKLSKHQHVWSLFKELMKKITLLFSKVSLVQNSDKIEKKYSRPGLLELRWPCRWWTIAVNWSKLPSNWCHYSRNHACVGIFSRTFTSRSWRTYHC